MFKNTQSFPFGTAAFPDVGNVTLSIFIWKQIRLWKWLSQNMMANACRLGHDDHSDNDNDDDDRVTYLGRPVFCRTA